MLSKLDCYWKSGNARNFSEQNLTSFNQFVSNNDFESDNSNISCAAKERYAMELLLFKNDLPGATKLCRVRYFADEANKFNVNYN